MRKLLPLLLCLFAMWLLPACSDDATKPPASAGGDGTIHGQIHDSDFEFEVTDGQPGDPFAGPFLLRGQNLHYNDDMSALVVDLTVVNRGVVAQHEPIGLTFIKLDPDEVTLLNPDNDVHDDGAAIVFHFANNDGLWTPAEESLPRTVEFGVSKGTAIAFVARIDLGASTGGVIAGRVWDDENKDGIMDASEGGLGGVGVYLHPFTNGIADPRLIRATTTDADGKYAFDGLPAGGYEVSIAPSTVTLFPTTPTGIHVLLTETDGGVSSYKNANFGAVPQNITPPPPQGEHIHAIGKFAPPDGFASSSVDHFTCPDSIPQPLVTDPPVNEDCVGGRLRGSVTEIAVSTNRATIRVMATWVLLIGIDAPPDLKLGDRVDVHVNPGPGPLTWVADSIAPWTGDHDEITGHVDAIEPASDGTVRFRVLDTWVTAAEVGVGTP